MKTIIALLPVIFAFTVNAQDPTIEWQNRIGGDNYDYLRSLQQTTDGGYILGGTSYSSISGDKTEGSLGGFDYWVIKLDSFGNLEWENALGGNQYDILNSIQQATDGGYLLGGYSSSDSSADKSTGSVYTDFWVVKLDSSGNKEWDKTIGGNYWDELYCVQQTTDGGYILGGRRGNGVRDYWVVKIDAIGNILWDTDIGGSGLDKLNSIDQTNDGGFILGGSSTSGISGDKTEPNFGSDDWWVVKIDSIGNIQWQKTMGAVYSDELYEVQQTLDGGYILGGTLSDSIAPNTYNYGFWAVKLDAFGNLEWDKVLDAGGDLFSIEQSVDHGYILGGRSGTSISSDKSENSLGGWDYWVVKLDSAGNIQWENTIGGDYWDELYDVHQTRDGGFILGGESRSGISGDQTEGNWGLSDIWVVKLNRCASLYFTKHATDNSFCGATDGTASVSVLSGSGNYTYQWSPVISTDSFLTGLSAGVYYITVSDGSCSRVDSMTVSQICGSVKGHVFSDTNGNGIKEISEEPLSGITVVATPGGYKGVTNQSGNFSINIEDYDTLMVQALIPSRYYCSGLLLRNDSLTAPPGNFYTAAITPGDSVSTGNDFGLKQPPNPCGTVSGYAFNDLNYNGADDGEPRQRDVSIALNNNQQAVSNDYGMYSVEVPFNVPVTLSTVPSPASYNCGASQVNNLQTFPPFNGGYTATLTTGSPNSGGNDFGIKNNAASYDVGVFNISPNAGRTAGKPFTVWIDFKATGSNSDTCYLRLKFNPVAIFVSAAVTPTSITNNYIEWCYPPGSAPAYFCMTVNFTLSPAAQAGTLLVWRVSYNCNSPDGCPGNNMLEREVLVNSGPVRRAQDNGLNLMEVFHTGNIQGAITTADSVLSYVINFQNTSTDTTYHLTIIDTLSPHLNIETISYPFSNLPFKMHLPGNNIVIWEFDNPLIPDSTTDYLNSYGFLQYNIIMKPNLPSGTVIENRATTIFNYINPYQTNTTSLRIYEPLSFSTSVTNVTCFEGNDGAIDLVVNGGTAPYDFSWSNGATTEDLLNVIAGNYSVTIKDSDNIVITANANVAEGFDIDAGSITGLDSVDIDQNASFSVDQVSGYTYSWSVTNGSIVSGQGTNNIEVDFDLPGQGTLAVVISAPGCSETVSKNVILTDPTGIAILTDGVVKIYPNPGSGIFKIVLPENIGTENHVKVYDVMGTIVLDQALSENSARVYELNLEGQSDGLYFVRVESGEKSWRGKVMLMN